MQYTSTDVSITNHETHWTQVMYLYDKRREEKQSPSDCTTHIFTFSSFDVSDTHKQTMMLQMISAAIRLVWT